MIKILYFGMSPNLGGIEVFVKNVYDNIDNVQIDFVSFFDKIYFEEDFIKNGSNVYKITPRRKNPIKSYLELFTFFKVHKEYEIIHFHLNSCSCINGVIIAKLFKRKVIIHSHNSATSDGKIRKTFDTVNKIYLPLFSDYYMACSKLAGKWMFGHKVSKKMFNIVYNGIDIQKYKFNNSKRTQIRQELNINDKFVIGHVGRFAEQKNHRFIIDIFKEISIKNTNAILLLIGDGELKNEIKNKVEILGLSNRVIFTGVKTNVHDYLQAMDCFLFPSLHEGLSIVFIEAQTSGLPCFASDTISKESDVTNSVKFISLNCTAEKWATEVLSTTFNINDRYNYYKKVSQAGYDIKNSAKWLSNFYKNII